MTRVCVIGTGSGALGHVRALRKLSGARVRISVAARDLAKADAFVKAEGLDLAYRSIDEVWASDEDVVVIATPPSSHGALLDAALAADKHVILEKPAFRSLEELRAFLPRLRAHRRLFMVGENAHFAPIHRLVVEQVRSGAIGTPVATMLNRFQRKAPKGWRAGAAETRGALEEGGIHWIRRALELSGVYGPGDVASVVALQPTTKLVDMRGDDTVMVAWKTTAGMVGELWHSWGIQRRGGLFDLSRVVGTQGTIAFDIPGRIALHFAGDSARPTPLLPLDALQAREDANGSMAMWRSFLGSLERGTRPLHTLEEAIADLAVVDAAYRSMASGRVETLAQI